MNEIKIGDVVYAEGSSLILGDVTAVDEDGYATVVWRSVTSEEASDDLIVVEKPATSEEQKLVMTFAQDAGPTYQSTLLDNANLNVRVTPVEGAAFDAFLVGPDVDGEQWNDIVVKRVDGEYNPTGEAFTVRVLAVHVT